MTVDVRIGIVSWNTAEHLARCLDALPAAVDGMTAEVVVVDNASTDGSAEVADTHSSVRVVRNETNVGYARAVNQALAGSESPVLIALNPDTVPPPGSLRALVERLRDTGAGVVVPVLRNPDGTLQHSVHRFPSRRLAAVVALPGRLHRGRLGRRFCLESACEPVRSGPVDWAIGAVHVIDAAALDPGEQPYTERWFMYVEDLELCHRLARRGRVTWLDTTVEVVHAGNAAGAQAWGDGRDRRWWWATYDFVHLTAGASVLRQLAALHLLSALGHLAGAVAASIPRRPGRRRHRERARALARVLDVHARVLARGAAAVTDERAGRDHPSSASGSGIGQSGDRFPPQNGGEGRPR